MWPLGRWRWGDRESAGGGQGRGEYIRAERWRSRQGLEPEGDTDSRGQRCQHRLTYTGEHQGYGAEVAPGVHGRMSEGPRQEPKPPGAAPRIKVAKEDGGM